MASYQPPRVFILNADTLATKKQSLATDPALQTAYQKLIAQANQCLQVGPFSVMHKQQVASSGDKHDYMSQGPYWWPDETKPDETKPDETKPDGRPYIRKDGQLNPERWDITDRSQLSDLIEASTTLALAYYYSDEERYAKRAAHLLRVWFLDSATRMNPHLNFGQAIPGRTEGRGIGIIETRNLAKLVDAIGLIEPSVAWTSRDQQGLQAWMEDYLDWLLHSSHGQEEAVNGNNHTTWYYTQAIALALFTNQLNVAKELAEGGRKLILDAQIEADGSQPLELARTKSWNYSVMNLQAMFYFSLLSAHAGKEYWHYVSPTKGSLQQALAFLLPYATDEQAWPYPQISEFRPHGLVPLLEIAANQFAEPNYTTVAQNIEENNCCTTLMY